MRIKRFLCSLPLPSISQALGAKHHETANPDQPAKSRPKKGFTFNHQCWLCLDCNNSHWTIINDCRAMKKSGHHYPQFSPVNILEFNIRAPKTAISIAFVEFRFVVHLQTHLRFFISAEFCISRISSSNAASPTGQCTGKRSICSGQCTTECFGARACGGGGIAQGELVVVLLKIDGFTSQNRMLPL